MINTPNLQEMESKETKVQKCFLPQHTHFKTEEKERRVWIRLKNMGLKFNKGKQTHLLAVLLAEGASTTFNMCDFRHYNGGYLSGQR